MQRQYKKHLIGVTALALCVLLVAGTFAWTNFASSIVNSFFGSGSQGNEETGPGGTLHNDFEEGKDYRDVYMENWGTEPLIVRIKLTEYMEIGEGAGDKNGAENNQAISIVDGASFDNLNSWTPFNGDLANQVRQPSDGFRYYWNWTMGGQKHYLPAPRDLRGTQDENGIDFVSTRSPVGSDVDLPTDYSTTRHAEVLSMNEWLSRGMPLGDYWVVDVDGYSYWAAPLEPEEATGLLLHRVALNNRPTEDYFYAINVVGHMATIDDAPDNYSMFLLDASENATTLVNKVADVIRGEDEIPDPLFRVESNVWGPPRLFPSDMEPIIFESVDQAHAFYNEHREAVFSGHVYYEWWSHFIVPYNLYNTTLIQSRFDDDFFSERALLFLPRELSEGTGQIIDVNLEDGALVLEIHRYIEFGVLYLGGSHYFIVNICRSLISDEIRWNYSVTQLDPIY